MSCRVVICSTRHRPARIGQSNYEAWDFNLSERTGNRVAGTTEGDTVMAVEVEVEAGSNRVAGVVTMEVEV